MEPLTIRPGTRADIAPLDALLASSYPRLLAPDYPPSVLVTAIPRISKAQPKLVTCGTYFVAYRGQALVGAGGWTRVVPGRSGGAERDLGHIRHFATDSTATRQGIARAVMAQVLRSARAEGIAVLECWSTRTAVSFYEAMGFATVENVDVPLDAGITFPAVRMIQRLGP
ncbi:MAG: GNAT family N-acetyltransferase [Pseudomonadota bacterium]